MQLTDEQIMLLEQPSYLTYKVAEAADVVLGPYDSITVTGHSKGGNKAQYVTVLSDKVDRCISMDGQRFSQEFLNQYYAEIEKKGGCIKNYFLDGDFVSILLFPVLGSDQICIEEDDSIIRIKTDTGTYWKMKVEIQPRLSARGKRSWSICMNLLFFSLM